MDIWGSLLQALLNTGGLPQMNTAPTNTGALGEYMGTTKEGTPPQINIKPGIPSAMQAPVQRHEQAHALMDRALPQQPDFVVDKAIASKLGETPQSFPALSEHFARFIEGQPQVTNNPLLFMIMRHLSDQIYREAMGATPAK